MTDFKFNQHVQTSKGPAIFIAYVGDRSRCQVSRKVPAKEFRRDELNRYKPGLAAMPPIDIKRWIDCSIICINEILPIDQITIPEKHHERSNNSNHSR